MGYKNFISSKFAIFTAILLLVFLGFLKVQQYRSNLTVEKEKRLLIAQEQSLRQKNSDLNQSLAYLNSPNFREKLAREQLNLKKEGEQVYAFSEKTNTAPLGGRRDSLPNYRKWINYFIN